MLDYTRKEIASVTIAGTRYVVREAIKGEFDIHSTDNGMNYRFFGSFDDPDYLESAKLEHFIREALRARTGIPC